MTFDDMNYAEYKRIQSDFLYDTESPCIECPNRTGNHCLFYDTELEEVAPGVYRPCDSCEDDFGEDETW